MKTFGNSAFEFLRDLKVDFRLPKGISCLMPFENDEVLKLNKLFYKKYFNDKNHRKMILGINPGRFGAGITGISFTDPVKLENVLGIKNSFAKHSELSSDFIYQMINAYGGPEIFYKRFYMTAASPIGFLKDGKNINYYDDKNLCADIKDFVVESIQAQLKFGIDRSVGFCLGEGENFKYLNKLNDEYHFFEQLIPLAHPRFIMQYKRKFVGNYIEKYLEVLDGTFSDKKSLIKSKKKRQIRTRIH